MNKRKRISKCLRDLTMTHPSWWQEVANSHKVKLSDLEKKGYIALKADGDSASEVTEEGLRFIEENPVYLRPSVNELMDCKVDVVYHRGKVIWVFNDDAGQQLYFYYKGECVGCGAYNPDYEDFIKRYLDDKMDFICRIDVPEYPSVRASLEFQEEAHGKRGKYLILSDRDEGICREAYRVGDRFTRNDKCVRMAKYIISIIKFRKESGKEEESKEEQR